MFTMKNIFLVVFIATATMPVFAVITVTVVKSENFKKTKAANTQLSNDKSTQEWGCFVISKKSLSVLKKMDEEKESRSQKVVKSLSVSHKKQSKETAGFNKYVKTLDRQGCQKVLEAARALQRLRISDQTNNN